MKITVLAFYDRISLFQTLKPLLQYKDRGLFHFTNSLDYCLGSDRNRVLFMFRWFLKPDYVDHEVMGKLRDKYDRIFFFNGNAGGGIPRLELLDYVDFFFSKALYKDRSLYGRDFYGDEIYNQFYHEKHPSLVYEGGKERAVCTNPEKLAKLRLYWNIGVGDFPKKKLRQRAGVWLSRQTADLSDQLPVRPFYLSRRLPVKLDDKLLSTKDNIVSARLGYFGDPFLNLHRETFEEIVKDNPLFLTGNIPQNQYNREMTRAAMVLSPFGWGELCFRDFEAVTQGALLLKPDVSHLETWPQVFLPGETYVSLAWDASDIIEKAVYYRDNREERERIVCRAYESYLDQIERTQDRLEEILELI